MRDDEFAIEVDKVNAGRINICMVQCHSGGFIDDLQGSNRIITTSCKYNEGANAMPPDYLYSEFTYHWISAIAGETPYGTTVDADSNNDSFVSMFEAFNYAKNQDTRPETPQYNSTPSSIGNYMALNGKIPYISGQNLVCLSNSAFSVDNFPLGATINWTSSSNLSYVSGQGINNYITRAANSFINSSGWIEAEISIIGRDDFTVRKNVWVGKPKIDYVTYDNIVCVDPITTWHLDTRSNVTSSWVICNNFTHYFGENEYDISVAPIQLGVPMGESREAYLYSENTCGSKLLNQSSIRHPTFEECGGFIGPIEPLTVSPNPTYDYINVDIDIENIDLKESKSRNNKVLVKLYNNHSVLVIDEVFYDSNFNIKTSNLKQGIYQLQVIYEGEKYSKQILIQH